MNSPEKIWVLPYEGSPDTGRFFPSKLAGTTEYVRADIAALNPDAIWNEAIEAAATRAEHMFDHLSGASWRHKEDKGDDVFCAALVSSAGSIAFAISLLKRQQGGNEA